MDRNERLQMMVLVSAAVVIILFIIAYRFFTPAPVEIYQVTAQNTVVAETYVAEEDKIHINTAGADELKKLEGIGDTLSQRIVDYRTEHGPFESIYDLLNVEGISDKVFLKIKPYITAD